jgi:hypothetical protein
MTSPPGTPDAGDEEDEPETCVPALQLEGSDGA